MFFSNKENDITAIYKKVLLFFSYYFITQNIITIAILPIYASWGIPFHLLSIIGNGLFLPFLSLYLILSLLIFIGFCFQTCSLTLIFFLKTVTLWWLKAMYVSSSMLPDISFAFIDQGSTQYLICWGALIIFFIFFDIKEKKIQSLLASFIFLSITILILKTPYQEKLIHLIDHKDKKFLLKKEDNDRISIIPLTEKKQYPKKDFLEYVVYSEIAKIWGITHPKIILLQPQKE
jgi:hypothetical protein